MTDNLNARGPADRNRVDLGEPWEAAYWAEKWNVNQDQLKRAVEKVGPMAKDVAAELGVAH
jgi:hypothetical protein